MSRILPLLSSLLLITFHITAQKNCLDADYKAQILSSSPEIARTLETVEHFIQDNINGRRTTLSGAGSSFSLPDVITIPVVVHIVYNTDAQNITDARVQSQIDALNNDYRKLNSDQSGIPSYFSGLAADCGIQFRLATADPKGAPTKGIVRRKTNIENFGTDDRVKYTSKGGDDAWDASHYLNIWVCNLTGGVIGYSSLIGCDAKADGVVIYTAAFGVNPSGNSSYNKGRTATHEIGHWLNLRHIWGDTYCGDDKVDDTPPQRSPNRGCPSGQNFTCGSTTHGDMYMNYMDLTNDGCMHMFTQGQRERMRALFMPGGPRNTLLTSNALSLPAAGATLENEPLSSSGYTVYPNPARTFITVQSAEAGATLIVYNHLGQPIETVTTQTGQTIIDISRFSNGMYYLRSKTGRTARFVKMN